MKSFRCNYVATQLDWPVSNAVLSLTVNDIDISKRNNFRGRKRTNTFARVNSCVLRVCVYVSGGTGLGGRGKRCGWAS